MGSLDNLALLSQPCLVIPNHQGDVTLWLQNCGDEEMEIPRCTAIGFLENLANDTFNEIFVVDEKNRKKRHQRINPSQKQCQMKKKDNFWGKTRFF